MKIRTLESERNIITLGDYQPPNQHFPVQWYSSHALWANLRQKSAVFYVDFREPEVSNKNVTFWSQLARCVTPQKMSAFL